MAVAQFADAGMPVYEDRYRLAVTRVARIPRVGEMPAGTPPSKCDIAPAVT